VRIPGFHRRQIALEEHIERQRHAAGDVDTSSLKSRSALASSVLTSGSLSYYFSASKEALVRLSTHLAYGDHSQDLRRVDGRRAVSERSTLLA
jgi:hypothetical protein